MMEQVAFAWSISERRKIAIAPETLCSRAALSTWIGNHVNGG